MRASVRCRASILIGVTALLAGCSNAASGTPAVVSGAITSDSASKVSSSAPMTVTTVTATVTSTTLAPPPSTATPSSPPTLTTETSTTETSAGPVIPPTDLTGEVYGFVTAVDVGKSEITLDKIDWFNGAAAQQACAEDGETRTDNNWCTGYYYRNVNPALRVVAVSPTAVIRTLADGTHSTDSSLNAVAARVAKTFASNTYRLTVTDGLVTSLEEMYHP